MFDLALRGAKDRLARPLARRLGGVPPNALTLAALAAGFGAALLAASGWPAWALLLWLTNRALDGLDGRVARLHDRQTDFGGYFDIVAEFLVYALIPIGLVWGDPTLERYLALAWMLASFYVNAASWMYLAAVLEKRGAHAAQTRTTIVMPAGIVGGTETIVAYGLFLIFPTRITVLFGAFTLLVLFTVVQRLAWAWRSLR
jgi:phosphatidylglycerophosphate synthase